MIVIQKDLTQLKNEVKQQVKSVRKQKEQEGIILVINSNEYRLSTSLSTRANLQAIIHSFQSGLLNPEKDKITWKFDDGKYLELDYNTLLNIAKCVLDYVEKLFLAEKEHISKIERLRKRESVKSYNVNEGWPNNRYEL